MKAKTKLIINIIVIIILLFTTYHLIYNQNNLNIIGICIFITYLSILYLIGTNYHNSTIIEQLKNKQTNYILKITIIGIMLLYSFQAGIPIIPKKEITNQHIHGKNIKKEALYTINKTGINPKNFSINQSLQKDAKDGVYKELFNKEKIGTAKINIHSNNFDYLKYYAAAKPTVMANSIEINNHKVKYVGIKTKGQSSLFSIISSNNNLFSYNIKFKEYIKEKNGYEDNQNLLGLNKISFNNMIGDPSKMKEYLSYYLFTEMDIPTPEYSHVTLTINNQYQGLYFMLEPIDKTLIKRTMNEKNDFLVKPETNGASLLYDKILDNYINDKGIFNFDSLLKDDKGNLELSNHNILKKYHGIWENDIETLEEVYDQLPIFFKTIKELNELSNIENKNTQEYEDRLNKVIDVDSLIKYLAVNIYIVNTDSYLSPTTQNYALYMNKDGKITIIPWDYNFAFGGAYLENTNQIINYDIYNPILHCKIEERPLINVILGNDKFRQKYETYLNDLTIISTEGGTTSNNKTYPKDNLSKMIDQKRKEIIEAEKLNYQAFYTKEQILIAQNNLKEIIKLRSESIKKQLNHEESKITSDIPVDTMGGYSSIEKRKWNTMEKN